MRLLSVNRDAKTIKGVKKGYLTGILYLLPNKTLCPCCSPGCRKACLVSAGHGQMSSVSKARKRKTQMFLKNRDAFIRYLLADIQELVDKADLARLKPCVRINGTSDIPIEEELSVALDTFPDVQFYDYTKDWNRVATRKNYHLTYSRSEKTRFGDIVEMVHNNNNVAVVFEEVPDEWFGMEVIKGDETDLRFLDKKGCIVGLKAKGKAKKDTTGFVVRI